MDNFKPIIIDDFCINLGRNIKNLRTKKNATQIEMAYTLETSTSVISLLENGNKHKTQLDTLIKIANYFEVSLETLFKN